MAAIGAHLSFEMLHDGAGAYRVRGSFIAGNYPSPNPYPSPSPSPNPNPSPNPSPNPNPNQETGLVDLPSRIWQAYHAQTASAALEQVDDPLGAVPMTPVAAFMM